MAATIGGSARLYYVRFRATAGTAARRRTSKTVLGRDYVNANGGTRHDPGVRLRRRQERRRLPERRRVRRPGRREGRPLRLRVAAVLPVLRADAVRHQPVGARGRGSGPPTTTPGSLADEPAGRRLLRGQLHRQAAVARRSRAGADRDYVSTTPALMRGGEPGDRAAKWVMANTAGGANAAPTRSRPARRGVRGVPAAAAGGELVRVRATLAERWRAAGGCRRQRRTWCSTAPPTAARRPTRARSSPPSPTTTCSPTRTRRS